MLRNSIRLVAMFAVVALLMCGQCVWAIQITIDYRYDINHFFDTNPDTTLNPQGVLGAQQAREALTAAAARYSAIITSPLAPVALVDDWTDARIEFVHPGTGASFEVSAAGSAETDIVVLQGGAAPADEYRNGFSLDADQWLLYAGARSLANVATGGTGAGTNWIDVFDDPNSHLNRGFNVGFGSLPVWGGEVSFDSDGSTQWHFDHTTAAPYDKVDFYSIALHELGHTLGLSTNWRDFKQYVVDSSFTGEHALGMLNRDNGTSVTTVPLESTTNLHWNDNWDGGSYQSYIFGLADPNLVGTVGIDALQDLLMEPIADFVFPTVRRIELTNVDVGGLEDVGWEIVSVPRIPGDTNLDNKVDETDARSLATYWGQSGGWAQGDFNNDTVINALDAAILAANWHYGVTESAAPAPEPGFAPLLVALLLGLGARRRVR
ncbi:MAG TPA: hypothetical protein DD670_03105 [Planctomycetaceae bacterium]|nr:hypothetical protein [Planctomycetaceae bacterium]